MIDLHMHTTFSDGELIPAELIRRAKVAGYKAMAITDHADASNIGFIIESVRKLTDSYSHFFDMEVLAGVELTHVPPALMAEFVGLAREAGAQIVVVHGETVVEPVVLGTNLAAIEAGVDVLAHPGLITEVDAKLAAERGVALEITTRRGHSYANGHVATLARRFGARLVIDNDAHAPGDLLSAEMRQKVAYGAGLTPEEYRQAGANAWEIVQRCRARR
jgi:putative hydrolase